MLRNAKAVARVLCKQLSESATMFLWTGDIMKGGVVFFEENFPIKNALSYE